MTSPSETEQTFLLGHQWNGLYRDRYAYERATILAEAVRSWRLNPLARQIARLYQIYNLDGINFSCEHKPTKKFLKEFWNHDLNNMKRQLEKISNEIFLTGNLFTLFSVDSVGMTYVRIFPTDQVDEIITRENDVQQEIAYTTIPVNENMEGKTYPNPRGLPTINTPVFMRHDSINLLAGCVWGEGEIWPDLPWLGRYATMLEDRVRLNRYRTAYMFVLSGKFTSEKERADREKQINANPPKSGSVLVHSENEKWGILAPKLDAFDASVDLATVKKMVAVNHAPLHYLAEPESATRTTADAAGTPVFKAYERQQETFLDIIHDILKVAQTRRAEKDDSVDASAEIIVTAADATERDNAALALAMSQVTQAVGELYDRELMDEAEYLRLVYRFSGETLPNNFKAPKGKRRPISTPSATDAGNGGGLDTATAGKIKIKTNTKTNETAVTEPKS
jgi:hypothetical protein